MPGLELIKEFSTSDVTAEDLMRHMNIAEDLARPCAESFYKMTLDIRFSNYNHMLPHDKSRFRGIVARYYADLFPGPYAVDKEDEFYQACSKWLPENALLHYVVAVEHFIAMNHSRMEYIYPDEVRESNENCIVNLSKKMDSWLAEINIKCHVNYEDAEASLAPRIAS